MENQALEKIIKRAIDKGLFKNDWWGQHKEPCQKKVFQIDGDKITFFIQNGYTEINIYELIFSTNFPRAFWKHINQAGQTGKGADCDTGWIFHQHKMLDEIQEGRDPIKYLGRFLD